MSLHLVAPAILARALNRSRMAGSPDCVCSFSEKLPTSRVCLGRSASCKMAGESSFQLRGDILAKWKIKQWHEETGGTRRGRTPPCTVSSKSLFTVLLYRVLLVARGMQKARQLVTNAAIGMPAFPRAIISIDRHEPQGGRGNWPRFTSIRPLRGTQRSGVLGGRPLCTATRAFKHEFKRCKPLVLAI